MSGINLTGTTQHSTLSQANSLENSPGSNTQESQQNFSQSSISRSPSSSSSVASRSFFSSSSSNPNDNNPAPADNHSSLPAMTDEERQGYEQALKFFDANKQQGGVQHLKNSMKKLLLEEAAHGHTFVVRFILTTTAPSDTRNLLDISDKDLFNATFTIAAEKKQTAILKVLIDLTRQYHQKFRLTFTEVLKTAISNQDFDLVIFLLEQITAQNFGPRTLEHALTFAAKEGLLEATRVITDHVPVNCFEEEGDSVRSAIQIAEKSGHSDVAKLLHEKYGDVPPRRRDSDSD